MCTAACLSLSSWQVGHRRDQYKRCAHLLEAVSQLLEHFSHYHDVPKIQSLNRRLASVQVTSRAPVWGPGDVLRGALLFRPTWYAAVAEAFCPAEVGRPLCLIGTVYCVSAV